MCFDGIERGGVIICQLSKRSGLYGRADDSVMKQPHRKKKGKPWIYIYIYIYVYVYLTWARTEVKVNFEVQFPPKA